MAAAVAVTTTDGRRMEALYAAPAGVPAPGVVILHEIFGMTAFLRSRLPLFAGAGYVAMAPDLYHRVCPGADFGYAGAEWEKAFAARNSLDDDLAVADAGAALARLRADPACNGQVAVVGYCLGGLLAFLAAARLEADANVCFHGVRLETHLAEAARVRRPLQMHFAGLDRYAPPPVVAAVKAALPDGDLVACHDYPDADHGFSREGQPVYNAAATRSAHAAMFSFLTKTLEARP